MKNELIVDVRTREEYYKEHIKSAINICLHDLAFCIDFLKDKKVLIYCNSGVRAGIAKKILQEKEIDVETIQPGWEKTYTIETNSMISAVNYIELKPKYKEQFLQHIKKLCQMTNEIDGFLGSKLLKISGISGVGSFLASDTTDEFSPDKYIIITYWRDKKAHNDSHQLGFFKEIYDKLPGYCSKNPYEEFYDILK